MRQATRDTARPVTVLRGRGALTAVLAAILPVVTGCAGFIVPNPPSARAGRVAVTPRPAAKPDSAAAVPSAPVPPPEPVPQPMVEQAPAPPGDTLDFALAFAVPPRPRPGKAPAEAPGGGTPPGPLRVPGSRVRVLVAGPVRETRLRVPDSWEIAGPRGRSRGGKGGSVTLRAVSGGERVALIDPAGAARHLALPCTLLSRDRAALFAVDTLRCRGALLLAAGRDAFSVVNVVDVEQYLRGVVPPEIGRRPAADIEAVKAQAVAARTYTYRRMLERAAGPYDLEATVTDQVYAGAGAEDSVSDSAVRATAGLVLVWGGAPILAYYHSTCGGRTANVAQVWGGEGQPYLRSVDDRDERGKPYCAASAYSSWECKWRGDRFSEIMERYGSDAACEGRYRGAVRGVRVLSRLDCGRVERVRIQGSESAAVFCGDKVRFAMRRDEPGNPILPSARFEVVRDDRSEVRVRGSGYGHGVGLCQMGALGRARAGQPFDRILAAYYPGATLCPVAPDEGPR